MSYGRLLGGIPLLPTLESGAMATAEDDNIVTGRRVVWATFQSGLPESADRDGGRVAVRDGG
jgi:hypothetical protein